MAVNLSPVGGVAAQFFTNTGAVLTGGKIYTYAAGTTTPATTYTSSQGTTAWTNPIVLDAAGRVSGSGEIWLTDGINYKFVLKDSNDVLIATYDNISGINSNFVAYTNSQEIQTATAGQTVFNLATMQYQIGTNSLSVFVDGVNQYGPGAQYAYTETDSDTVTFVSGLHVGAEVKFTSTQQQGAGAIDASQVSYDPPFTGSVATNVEAKLAETVSVIDFGADPSGLSDSTAAINAAITYAMSGGHKAVYFPQGSYEVSTILISNPAYTLTLVSDGAEFQGNATVPTNGIFDLVNCYDLNMLGAYKLNVGGNANYSSGLSIRSAAGGNGGTSRNSFYNITVRQAKVGISVGAYNVDLACSELDFFGCKFFECPVAIYNAGSQTLSQWQGCEIISEPFAAYSGLPERAIWIEGGVVSVTGGSIVKATTATPQTILFNPASSATFGNPYGGLRIAGTHIESNCQLLTIANSRSLTTPGSSTSNVTIVAAGGYAGLSAAEDFITVLDSTYAGTVEVTSCNFYAPSARTAFSISCVNTNPVLVTDYKSFGTNFRPWYDGGFSFGTDASIFPYNGSYTATATGMTTSPTGTIIYSRVGKSVTMSIPNIFGTSNATTFTLTGGDAAMKPSSNRVAQVVVGDNGGAAVMAIAIIGTNGIIQLFANLSGTGFTASGTKAVGECTLSYVI